MKILVVCQFYYPEGFSITDVCEEFVRQGHEVYVVTGKPNYGYGRIVEGYEKVTDEVINGVKVHRCDLVPRSSSRISIIRNYLSFWMNSKRYLRRLKERFDCVYSMSLSPLISIVGGTIYARKHHVRHVLHCLDLWPESTVVTGAVKKKGLLYRVLHKWCRRIYSGLDEILVSSPSFERYFREELNIKDVPITYVPQPPQVAKPSCEVTYTHKNNFVYAGNIGTLQLVENLVKATAIAKEKIDMQLHLIGMGTRSEAVKDLIQELGLQDSVQFYGIKKRDVTASYYVNADGIIVSLTAASSVGSTIPSKLNSSLVYGRPILAVIQGDGRKVLEESNGAVFSDGESPEEIAEAMIRLASLSEEEKAVLGKNNADYFAAHYHIESIVGAIVTELGQ